MPARDHVLEQEILSNPRRLREGPRYARVVLQGRWPDWEKEALQQAKTEPLLLDVCILYAVRVIKGPWPALEEVLFQLAGVNPRHKPVLFRKADGTDPEYTIDPLGLEIVKYARDVIQGPWPSFESLILNGKCRFDIAVTYTARIRGRPWTALQNLLLGAFPDDAMVALARYASAVRNGKWPAAEKYFLKHPAEKSLSYALYYYARHALKGELPAPLYAAMMFVGDTDPNNNWVESYLDFLKTL
jgi:hypothetical protein